MRLQDELGTPLFRKRGRGLALTEAGEVALTYARRILALHDELLETMQGANVTGHIRVGCTMDFALILPPVLSHFASLYPQIQVELRIEGNAALADAVEKAQIDLAVVIGHAECAALIIARFFLRGVLPMRLTVITSDEGCEHQGSRLTRKRQRQITRREP